jgi:predicted enzyme related to lactoylglutathione lyase
MPTRDLAPAGAPCWIDIFTSDVPAARTFYGELFGWTSEEPNEEMGGYFNFFKDGVRVAGGMTNDGSQGTADAWGVHLRVDDAKAAVDAAAEHGGQVVFPAMDMGDVGIGALVVDPGGAAIGIWETREHKGFGVIDEPGAPGWFELHTRAHAQVVEFYEDVFGWTTVKASDTDEFRYTLLVDGEQQLAGVMDDSVFPEEGNLASQWHTYFKVADVDATLARVTELGGTIINEAEDTPFGRLAGAIDPTGAMFKLTGPNLA